MPRSIQIRFATTATLHRVRNFAEELSLALSREQKLGSLQMKDADMAIDHVVISDVPAAKLTRSISLVRELLLSHKLNEEADVSALNPPPASRSV